MNVPQRTLRKVQQVVGKPVQVAGMFVPEGTRSAGLWGGIAGVIGVLVAQRAVRGPNDLPRNVVLALTEDAVVVLRKRTFRPLEVVARWQLEHLSATVTPTKLSYALRVKLRDGREYRLETPVAPLGGRDPFQDVAYAISRAGQPAF